MSAHSHAVEFPMEPAMAQMLITADGLDCTSEIVVCHSHRWFAFVFPHY
jgi:HrpA-like RNA helicase